MPKSPNQKLKLLYLMEILLQQTDERHPMTVPEMIAQLAQRGVSAERKSIYGDLEALRMLGAIRKEFGVPVVTDIHNPEEAAMAAEYVDVLQIPAFLCRQTDLLVAAAKTGKAVNIKKGQFLSPEAMAFAAGKVRDAGNPNILLTDRGTMFGYHDLIVDMRSIPSIRSSIYWKLRVCSPLP